MTRRWLALSNKSLENTSLLFLPKLAVSSKNSLLLLTNVLEDELSALDEKSEITTTIISGEQNIEDFSFVCREWDQVLVIYGGGWNWSGLLAFTKEVVYNSLHDR